MSQMSGADATDDVRGDGIHFDKNRLRHPPKAIAGYIAKMLSGEYLGPERRGAKRHHVVASVPVMPVAEDLSPAGEAFMAMTRDISTTGIALISARAVNSQLLVVELPPVLGKQMQVLIRVSRCRAVGRFYEIAGTFDSKKIGT